MSEPASLKPHIAILEDHDDTREMLRVGLESDFSISPYKDAAELLSELDEGKFSAIIADVMLPGLDGFGFIRAIRSDQRYAQLCVIAVTALAHAADREKGMASGFTDYLVKPISPDEIKAVLWNCLPAPGSSAA
jgi:DNA-binding response OmpR family regulator